ncbi:MAG: hypothetical protein OXU73_00885 [Candidatus Campbellbacteria bacterium]|nr:hypothetical protein [Candidatus Campbellbacteria bacterium]
MDIVKIILVIAVIVLFLGHLNQALLIDDIDHRLGYFEQEQEQE